MTLGVDVGGTFTDLVKWDGRALSTLKIPSSPPAFELAVVEAARRACGGFTGVTLIHGSTVATNALLQRAVAAAALIVNSGFGDVLMIGRQNRPKLNALSIQRPPPVIQRDCVFPMRGRIDAAGTEVAPLDHEEIERIASRLMDRGIRDVAVCLLFSFANPSHEQAVGAILEKRGLAVTLSSELCPVFREYERASTTSMNAALRPIVASYLTSLERSLPAEVESLRVMHGGGGTTAVDRAIKHSARLVLSGPAGGVRGASFIARQAGYSDVVTCDMGGTSTDVAVIRAGAVQWTASSVVDGLPTILPMFQINTVGAGGGSVARVDSGGALRVGPVSAGAIPGPACYGRGGTEPTVTDANVLLGRIPTDNFCGGTVKLLPDRAHAAIHELATKLSLSTIETALGILRIAESSMSRAIAQVTSRRGIDPRGFALMPFGGAGGLHACAIADSLGIRSVIVPPLAGLLSALGMIVSEECADSAATVAHRGAELDDDRLAALLDRLGDQARAQLSPDVKRTTEYFADVRFAGQSHELSIPVTDHSVAAIRQTFRAAYLEEYSSIPVNREVEIVNLRARVRGATPAVELPVLAPIPTSPPVAKVVNDAGSRVDCRVMKRGHLLDVAIAGPMLIVDDDATTWVPETWKARAESNGTVLLHRGLS